MNKEKMPNIIIFNPEQFRVDALGHMGNPASHTPNFDRIIESDAVSFRNAFCQNPMCTPSRCSFMTGWYPHVHGHRSISYALQAHEPMLLKTLKDNGYFVWWGLGKNDLIPGQNTADNYYDVLYSKHRTQEKTQTLFGNWQKMMGPKESKYHYSFFGGKIDKGDNEIYYDDDWGIIDGAINLIKNPPADRPFCIFLPMSYAHPIYAVEEPWFSMIDRAKLPQRIPAPENMEGKASMLKGLLELYNMEKWTEEEWNELRAVYLGMCSRVDHHLGLLVDALKEAGNYDQTAIFAFSDHGDYTGDYGITEKNDNTFEDCLVRVPFIIKPPASVKVKPGIRNALVELVDFSATVEALTGIIPEHTHFGRSLLPIIQGETDNHRDAVFSEGGRIHGEAHCAEYKLRPPEEFPPMEERGDHPYWPRCYLTGSEGPERTKAVMCRDTRYKYIRRLYEQDEFYDLQSDPQEVKNRINDPALSQELARLKDRLLTFYLETGDVVPFTKDKRNFLDQPPCK